MEKVQLRGSPIEIPKVPSFFCVPSSSQLGTTVTVTFCRVIITGSRHWPPANDKHATLKHMPLHIEPVTLTTVHPDDVAATLHGLNGTYRNTDLYARYRSIALEAGRQPGSSDSLGRHIAHYGYERWTNGINRGWIIPAS